MVSMMPGKRLRSPGDYVFVKYGKVDFIGCFACILLLNEPNQSCLCSILL